MNIINILTLVVLLSAANCWATTDFKTRFFLDEEYNDNLFLSNDDESEDFITTLEPGIEFYLDRRDLKLELDYSLRFRLYQENQQNNQTDLSEVQRGLANLVLWPGKNFTVLGQGEIKLVTIDERDAVGAASDLINRSLRYRALVNPRMHLPISKTFAFNADYAFERIDYERLSGSISDNGDNTKQHRYQASVIYNAAKGTTLSLGYALSALSAEVQEDYRQDTQFFGLKQDIGKRMLLDLSVGSTQIDLESSGSSDGQVWDLTLSYRVNSKSRISLDYSQNYYSSVEQGAYDSEKISVAFDYSGKFDFQLGSFWANNEYLSILRRDRSFNTTMSLKLPLSSRFDLRLSGIFSRYDFQPEDEQVNRYTFETGLSYLREIGTFSLNYQSNQNDSSFAVNDYTNNIVMLKIDLRFK